MDILFEVFALEYVKLSVGSFISGGILAFTYWYARKQSGNSNLIIALLLSIPFLALISSVELYVVFMYLLGVVVMYSGLIHIFSETSLTEEFETETSSLQKKYKW